MQAARRMEIYQGDLQLAESITFLGARHVPPPQQQLLLLLLYQVHPEQARPTFHSLHSLAVLQRCTQGWWRRETETSHS